MTKKDYELIARCIKGTLNSYPEANKPMEMLTAYLSSEFEVDNPKFDRNKFLIACGIETYKCPVCWRDADNCICGD